MERKCKISITNIKINLSDLTGTFYNLKIQRAIIAAVKTILNKTVDEDTFEAIKNRVNKKEFQALGYVEYYLDEELILRITYPDITNGILNFQIEKFYET